MVELSRKCEVIITASGAVPASHTVLKGATVQKAKIVEQALAAFSEFEGGKCIERWSVTDSLALAVKLGAFPGPK